MPPCGILVPAILMCASVRVEGKLFEVSREKGAVFLSGWQRLARGGCSSSNFGLMNLDGWQEKWFVYALQRGSLCGWGPLRVVIFCCWR